MNEHIQWHPPLIGHYTNFWPLLIETLLPNLTFYLIVQGFHKAYAMGAACQQRTLTPPDTWSCPTSGLACVLMSRPNSHELVLSPDFWISNIPRYFSFASIRKNAVRLTDFVHKYLSFYNTCTCEISKESSKYQYSYWHVKWPQSYTLAYIWRWKGESVEIGDVNIHKKSCCDEKFAPTKGWGTNFWEKFRIYAILIHD